MSLRPFFEASLAIQIHEIAALLAFALGSGRVVAAQG